MQNLVPNKYSDCLTLVQKKTGKRTWVLVVKSKMMETFLERVMADSDIPLDLKVLIALGINSGCRISELLAVKKKEVKKSDKRDRYYFTTKVLKKDRAQERKDKEAKERGEKPKPWNPVTRLSQVPSVAQENLGKLLAKRKPHEYLFRLSRFDALYAIRKHFGQEFETHSFRRSYVSLLMHKNRTSPQIAEIVKMDERTVQNYTHITDFEEELDAISL